MAGLEKLSALRVKNAKPGEKLGDGGGLNLHVDRNGNASWCFRFTSPVTKRERAMGLGPLTDMPLAKAREAARAARDLLRQNIDPIEERNAQRAAARVSEQRGVTFRAYAERYIGGKESAWKSAIHRQQWRNTLRDYAYPHIGDLPVADVDTEAVLTVLRPIWSEKPETARRVRGRIEAVLNGAKAQELRVGPNPALWRGHLDQILAKRRKADVRHRPALPYGEVPEFWQSLAGDASDAARMLRWIILTACRYGEAAGMDAGEVKGDLWTIPAARMKADRDHVVPLTAAALAQLPFRPVSDVSLSNCIRRHTSTPATTHGFRSTFRDWAGDETEAAWKTAEAALAHKVGNETEAAYRRATALRKRRTLMDEWATYCGRGDPVPARCPAPGPDAHAESTIPIRAPYPGRSARSADRRDA